MEGLEFDVDAARPQTSFDLKRFTSGRAERLHPEILMEKQNLVIVVIQLFTEMISSDVEFHCPFCLNHHTVPGM